MTARTPIATRRPRSGIRDALCFVQFLHPGREPNVRTPGELPWNTGDHTRKFIVSRGAYRETANGPDRQAELGFWAEWEAQTLAEPVASPVDGGARWLHRPFFDPPASGWAQNTDPFVFGPQFHFTGCQQHRAGGSTQLAHLLPGSLVLFGSHRRGNFVLDTVFVAGENAIDHSRGNHRQELEGEIAPEYDEVTIRCWYSGKVPDWQVHRLYFGASPAVPFSGMFSFFPCLPLESAPAGFARPTIDLPGITQAQTQSYRRTFLASASEAAELWRAVVEQVLDAELALGVHAELPRRRGAAVPAVPTTRENC